MVPRLSGTRVDARTMSSDVNSGPTSGAGRPVAALIASAAEKRPSPAVSMRTVESCGSIIVASGCVVVADDGEVVGHAESQPQRGAQRGRGDVVVVGGDGRDTGVTPCGDELGHRGIRVIEIGGEDRLETERRGGAAGTSRVGC